MQLFEWQGNEEDFPIKQTENIKRREFENVRQKSTFRFSTCERLLMELGKLPSHIVEFRLLFV